MTQIHYRMPPELEKLGAAEGMSGLNRMCLVCMMFAKGDQVDATEAEWRPLLDDGFTESEHWVAWGGESMRDCSSPIREAVVMGISDLMPNMPLLPLCWDHLGAIRRVPVQPQREPARVQPATVVPPGFGNGHGGQRPRRR